MDNNTVQDLNKLVATFSSGLESRGWKVATVESCTGGRVAALFTDFSGSSNWFDRGFVTYSNRSKVEMVGVDFETLERFGAVSEQVASEMAQGGVAHSDAQCALAITGIAGPEGGSGPKPVGMVCFAWAGFNGESLSKVKYFDGDRQTVRDQCVLFAIREAVRLLGS